MADYNTENICFDYIRGFTIDFNLLTGLSDKKATSKRYLSQMRGMFADDAAFEEKLKTEGDQLVYEFHELGVPEKPGDLAFGCSITYPGKVGNE